MRNKTLLAAGSIAVLLLGSVLFVAGVWAQCSAQPPAKKNGRFD